MSAWGEMRHRGSGSSIRKEEEAVFMDPDMISPTELAKMMGQGIVHFQYRKKPKKGQTIGDIRDAWGTKRNDIITKIPHGGDCPPKRVGYSIYFDVEKGDWRAYWDGNLVGVWSKVYNETEFPAVYAKFNADTEEVKDEPIPEEI